MGLNARMLNVNKKKKNITNNHYSEKKAMVVRKSGGLKDGLNLHSL